MQVLIPKPITAANFISSTIAETEHPVWVSTTAYTLAARVIRSGSVYESLIAGNLGRDPAADAAAWLRIGPTNRWALFDDSPGTATTAASSFRVDVTPGAVTDIVLIGAIGSTVNIYAAGTLVRTASIPAPASPATSSTVKITGLSIAAGVQIGVQITGSGTVQCAMLLLGSITDIGGTQDGASVSLVDYSRKETDKYGTVKLARRGYARKITASVSILAGAVETVDATLRRMRGTVGYWIVDDSAELFQAAGILSDWSLTIQTKAASTYSATVMGLSRDDAVITPGASYEIEGQDATGAGQIVLTQPAILLPADQSGAVPSFAGAVCTVSVVQAGQNATAHWSLSKTDTGCTSTLAGNVVTITAMSADTGSVEVTATRAGLTATARISVAKAKTGAGGLSVTLGNESPVLRASSGGAVASYSGSGCTITALEGAVALTASATATASAFRIGTISQSPAGAITVGAVTYTGTTALIGAHSAMSSAVDQVVLSIPVTVYRADGSTVSFVKTQTISKAKDGANGANGTAGTNGVRGSANVSRQIAGAAWSNTEAATALSANGFGSPLHADVVTLFNPAAVPAYTETRIYLSGAWEPLAQHLNGSLLVDGTVVASKIDSRGLTIRDAAGNVLLGAGSGIPADYMPGLGVNLVPSSDFTTCQQGAWPLDSTDRGGWRYGSANGITVSGAGVNLHADWTLTGAATLYMSQGVRWGGENGFAEVQQVDPMPVTPGGRYALSAYTGAHRCSVAVFAYFYDTSGASVGFGLWSTNDAEKLGGNNLTGYKRQFAIAEIPANAVTARIVLRKYDTMQGEADSRMFVTRVQFEQVGALAQSPGPWTPGGPTKINPANASTVIASGAIGNALIGRYIASDNFDGTIDAAGNVVGRGTAGWAIGKGGLGVFNALAARGSVMGGAFTGWGWPAAGGTGYYLGAEGLLLGNLNTGRYVQIGAEGNLYAPGLSIVDGSMTLSQANIINTLNLNGESVSVSRYAFSSGSSASVAFTLTNAASVFVIGSVSVPTAQRNQILRINGSDVRNESVTAGTIPCLIYMATLGPGTHTAQILNTGTEGFNAGIMILATMR